MMLEALRGLGYSTAAALADLIDNSITAQARTVHLGFLWAGPASAIRIVDDGNGMDAEELDQETKRKVVTHLPLLLIDDEADHASVDTGNQIFDEQAHPDQQHEPTAINRLVRRILHTFNRSAYVGYTATPFANIFIHDQGETREEGPDLFPSSFIINLAAHSNYVGPARVFGFHIGDVRETGLPLVREVTDYATGDGSQGWMPQKHKSTHLPRHDGQDILPPSLVEAIDGFFTVLCGALPARPGP
jgi:hypothetical protein